MTAFDNILRSLGRQEVILPIFENRMRVRPDDYYGTGDGYFHPSTHPLMDERLLYYLMNPRTQKWLVDEPFTLQREMTVEVGHALHNLVQKEMIATGLVDEKNVELEFIIVEHHVRGRIDMIVDHPTLGPIVVEIKSRTHYKFGKTNEPLPEWDAQLSIQLDSQGLEKGIILMVETGYPFRIKELPVARNDKLLGEIYGRFDRVREAIALDRTPVPCCAPNSTTVTACPARFACWHNPEGPQ